MTRFLVTTAVLGGLLWLPTAPVMAQGSPRQALVFSQRTFGFTFSAFAVNSAGDLWAAGDTCAADLPTTSDAIAPAPRGECDAFVARLRPDGSVAYLTYLGGSGSDFTSGIATDAAGNVYVTGRTSSPDFPTTTGAHDRTCGADGTCRDGVDGYVVKLTPSGTQIVYATYFGGSDSDQPLDIAVDSAGRAHLAGATHSQDMPKTANAVRTAITGIYDDAFYARFNAAGSALEYSTYLGGTQDDVALGLALDAAGNAYLTGWTRSPDFTLYRPFDGTFSGANQSWVARFDNGVLQFSSFLGGSSTDQAYDVAVNGDGFYVAGAACSTDFPGAPRPPSPTGECNQAAFVSKLRLDGSGVIRTSMFDGNGGDYAMAVDVDANSVVFVAGATTSTDFPVTSDAAQPATPGGSVVYVVVPMADGAGGAAAYSTYLGGAEGGEYATTIAIDRRGGAFIGGTSSSPDFPTVNGTQPDNPEESHPFIAHFVPQETTRENVPGEVVLYAAEATAVRGNWQVTFDASAAGGARMWNPDAGVAKIATPAAAPPSYFELTFTAEAGVPYHLWLRMKADHDHWSNDSVYVQFSDSVDAAGNPVYRIGSTSAAMVSLEDCTGCGEQGWGWNDNGYNTAPPAIVFATSGTHTIRIQQREDGVSIDQIVLSARTYLSTPPGGPKNDSTVLSSSDGSSEPPPPPPPPTSDPREIVLYAATDRSGGGTNWQSVADGSAAGGSRLYNPDQGQPKLSSPSSAGSDYFEITFNAEAGVPYHLWIRSRAANDYWGNDSVFVQFSGSVDASGTPTFRIGSGSATMVSLEDCSGCGEQGWGWNDNGYGYLGENLYFAASGPQTIRVLRREDGISIDQIVLSAGRFLSSAPGTAKNDATIVPR